MPYLIFAHKRFSLSRPTLVARKKAVLQKKIDLLAEDQRFGGRGLVVGPDGDVLASTSRQAPFATVAIDLTESTRAKKTYPRDLLE